MMSPAGKRSPSLIQQASAFVREPPFFCLAATTLVSDSGLARLDVPGQTQPTRMFGRPSGVLAGRRSVLDSKVKSGRELLWRATNKELRKDGWTTTCSMPPKVNSLEKRGAQVNFDGRPLHWSIATLSSAYDVASQCYELTVVG